jgi:signal transduction histidine kinase/ligand-binding sensor domain-containing protein
MQRTVLILACFITSATCFTQLPESHEQYPFVHYTPKDGLISNMIKGIYQDSKGRLYFTSLHGLSVYDGSRFINYNSKNGLNYDIVNCLIEMGDDSLWIITNSPEINCLVKGRIKSLLLYGYNYIINNLCRDSKGDIYAAAEEGLLLFNKKDRFIKLPFVDANRQDISSYASYVFSVGDYLLVQRDNSMLPTQNEFLYLYNKTTKKITAEIPGVYAAHVAKDGRVWVSTKNKIMSLDTVELAKGKLVLKELPQQYSQLRNKGSYFVIFDDGNNCWLGDQNGTLIKAAPDGSITTFTAASGLNMFFINRVFQDREGITWIATNNTGVSKLVHTNFSHIEKPFGIVYPSDISYNKKNLLIYSSPTYTVVIIHNNGKKYLHIKSTLTFTKLIETPYGFFGINRNTLYKLGQKRNILYPKAILSDSSDNVYPNFVVDKNGNLIVSGKYHLSVVIKGNIIYKSKIPFFADLPVTDSKGNVWIATRANELLMYKTHPEDPSNYLEQKFYFKKELTGISPRSIVIDKNNNIWIGTRNHGIHVFYLNNGNLIKKFVISPGSGLSDEFISHLTCGEGNAIWASSALGLDKITIKNGVPVIENITRQNNIYQSVFTVVSDKDNNVWGLVSNGIIKITPEKKEPSNYSPTLMVSMLKAGKDTIHNKPSLSYRQNNLSFSFTATSFINEKQVLYNYRLQGGTNNQWSEPSNNATVSFIDLPPGNYKLDIKASFPAGRYPEKIISYQFSIAPPWWGTWWFRSLAMVLIIGLLITGFRFYYRRKLEKQMAVLEKRQAIEKERTRIATDMHDDLGAGLSRIKFLSETIGIKKQQHEPIEEDVNKIREYSHEMIDKMGEIVWALNEKNDSLSDLLSYTRSYTMEYLSQNGIGCKTEMPDSFPSVFVSGEFRRNVFLTIKEALHNIVKHSQATEVKLSVRINHHLSIKLKDNGTGFDKNNIRSFSNGLSNMESRVKEIGGRFEIANRHGTLINLEIPLHT